jgi:hypothetical protein
MQKVTVRRLPHWENCFASTRRLMALTMLQCGGWLSVGTWAPLATGAIVTGAIGLLHPAQAAVLTDWEFDPSTQRLEVTVPEGTTPRYFLLAQPARIVLDLPNTEVGAVASEQSYAGAVRQIRVGQFAAGLTRIVLELSPDAVLAPGQVELRQATADQSSHSTAVRWVLRPLLANGAPSAIDAAPNAVPDSAAIADAAPAELAENTSLAEETAEETAASATLPPLEPNSLEIPVLPAATAIDPTVESAAAPDAASDLSSPANPSIAAAPALPSTLPTLPPSAAPVQQTQQPPPVSQPDSEVAVQPPLPTLPPALPSAQRSVTVTVPPLQPPPVIPSVAAPTEPVGTAPVSIEFGQPLPRSQSAPSGSPSVAFAAANVLIPSGTILSLRYPRETALRLQADSSRQEVLVLQRAVRDAAGRTLAPEGSQVIGRFETSSNGSRFIAQAITLQGRNLQLHAESAALDGDRQLIEADLISNSAIGALALGILGGFTGIGILGGALAGAATTYLTAPQPATIQPNQVLEVRVVEDLPRLQGM